MSTPPPISVLLPVYNGQPYLAESIESILKQEYSNFELLIIDDASTDESVSTILKFHDSRIRLIRHINNLGLIGTLNQGLKEARHELIARHDQDDIAYPERLLRQVNLMNQHPEIGVCGTGAYILENGQRTTKIIFPASDAMIRWTMPFYSPLIHPSIMYRRSVVRLVSGYSTSVEANYSEDYDLWCKLLAHTKFHNITAPLMYLRKHQASMTNAKQAFHLQQTVNITKRYVDGMLNHDLPIGLIRWLRGFPDDSTNRFQRIQLLFFLYANFTTHHLLTLNEWAKITANTGTRVLQALKAN